MLKLGFTQNDWTRLKTDEKKIFSEDLTLEVVIGESFADFHLFFDEEGWKLASAGSDWAPLHIDFQSNSWKKRVKDPLRWRDPLMKACSMGPQSQGIKILDLTAGLGSDSKMFQELGAEVTAFERSAPLYWMLKDALIRAGKPAHYRLIFGSFDVSDWARYSSDVIYLDPMFPLEKKKALPPREMQYLRKLLGESSEDYFSLLERALKTPAPRVVMKSALKGPVYPGRSFSVEGKSHRFDVFVRSF